MTRTKAALAALLLCVTTAGGAAAQQTGSPRPGEAPLGILCQLKVPRSQNWVPEVVFIGHDPAQDLVIISDSVGLAYNSGQPVAGRVAVLNTRRVTYAWDFPVRDAAGNQARRMLYRATIQLRDGSVQISASPGGYDNRFIASGRCQWSPLEAE